MATDPKVLELRRLMAERYKQARPEDRPQPRDCNDCGKSVFSSEVCMMTGRLHNLDAKIVVGGVVVDKDKRFFTGGELVAAIDRQRVKWQAARTSKVSVDADSAMIFQTFVLQRQWKLMRYGIMYGTYDAATHEVFVHSIFEPEQVNSETGFDPVPDPLEERVNLLASYLGLIRVGIVMTHPPRDVSECVLEGKELLLLAREQSRFGDHCVLFAISPNPETQQIDAVAWQASQQCVNLYRIGLITESTEDPRFVYSSQPLEVAQEDRDAKGRQTCVTKEPSRNVDAQWMLAPVAVAQFSSDLIGNRFIRLSRPGEAPPNFTNLRRFFDDPKRKQLSLVEQVRDFHVLVFLMVHVFDVRSDMPHLVKAVLAKNKNDMAAFEAILRDYMRPSA
jgi:nuclear protein localization family protein 4